MPQGLESPVIHAQWPNAADFYVKQVAAVVFCRDVANVPAVGPEIWD